MRAFRFAGFTVNEVALVADLPVAVVDSLYKTRPDRSTLTDSVVEVLSTIPFHPLLDSRPRVPAAGVVRRLRALAARGITLRDMAAHIGCADTAVDRLIGWTDPSTVAESPLPRHWWFAAAAVFDAMSMRLDELDEAVRAIAGERGWVVPLDWDEDDIDDPHARSGSPAAQRMYVDDVAVYRRLCGDRSIALNGSEKARVVELSIDQQWSQERLADVLGDKLATAIRRQARMQSRRRNRMQLAECPDENSPTGDSVGSESSVRGAA